MDILLFPVKRAGRYVVVAVTALGGSAGCGYRSRASVAPRDQLCVRAARPHVAEIESVQGALTGARRELARYGALRDGSSGPCLVVEVLRIDETASALADAPTDVTANARSSTVAIVARGWVETEPEAPPTRDTGDVRASMAIETSAALRDPERHRAEVEAAGEAAGTTIARRVLGLATVLDAPP